MVAKKTEELKAIDKMIVEAMELITKNIAHAQFHLSSAAIVAGKREFIKEALILREKLK